MRRKGVTFIFWLLVAAGLLGAFWYQLDWPLVRESLRRMNVTLALLAIVPILATYLTRALRWRVFLTPVRTPTLGNALAATVIGFSTIFVFGRIGEATRPLVLSLRERIRPSATLATILIERICDMITVTVAFAVSLFFVCNSSRSPEPLAALRNFGEAALLLSLLGLVGLSVFRFRADGILEVLERRSRWIPEKLRRPALNLLRHLADGLSVLHDVRALARAVGYTLMTWGLVTASFWLVVRAFGLHLTVASVIFVIGFAMLGSLVPTPGGSAGAFHTTTMLGLMWLGIERNTAASMALIMHVVSFGPALLVSPYFLRRGGFSWGPLRELVLAEMTFTMPSSRETEREDIPNDPSPWRVSDRL
ncbi:MAG: flippase-like domain-containing protein [Blastocatellia bacterium]|nr:flippase-like domain-containing protein [Blastocatellia bacterium]MCS7156622.1 flippase-like domain-containing protein [Blastocatellia bacterium]MCX7751636.1 flippase-like domain-containing protein [Blastocatellia bacterium]MDW8168736.1 lysylphosphatidylglycerol synthase transmembrane domain-containing protein [Acidobacteriota bacterium]MDW8257002.1 lysylphosphatidylglycerol synthase transmembrane domain-containing protein [Acidobacteriota bacterium]